MNANQDRIKQIRIMWASLERDRGDTKRVRKVDAELARSCPQDEPRWTVESIAADREWLSYLELRKTLADELAEAGGIADLLELTSRMEHEVVRNLILFSCVEFLLSRESYQDARKVVDDGAFTPRWRIAAAIAVAGCARVQSDIVLARDLIACHTEMEDRFRYTMDLWHATGDGGDLERLRKAARVLYPVERCDAFRRIAMHTCDDRDFIECIVSAEQIEDRFFREKAIEEGMTTLLQDGVMKALKGDTTLEQVRKVCIK